MPVIRDVKGGTLNLGKVWLTEVTGMVNVGERWKVRLTELPKAIKSGKGFNRPILKLHLVESNYRPEHVGKLVGGCSVFPGEFAIGCRTFDEKTFARILKAAGVPVQKRTKAVRRRA